MSDQFSRLRDHARDAMGRLGVPGVALGVIAGGETHVDGLGVTNVDHPLDVTADTLFQIGSISKTITGTAVMRLVEQGRLDLDAPVRRYLADLQLSDAGTAEQITLRHLLTHMSGLQGDFFLDTGWGDDALARYVARMVEIPQIAPLGTLWSYCNAGFNLAGRVVEAVAGQPIERAIGELVFAPLGMDRAFFLPHEVMTYRFAVGHRSGVGGPEVLRPWPIPRAHSAVGAVCTSVAQLLRYAALHLEPDAALAPMQVAQGPAGNFADMVGLTWMLRDMGGVRVVAHGGATNGQMAQLALVPERGFALVLLTNGDRGSALNLELMMAALEIFLGAQIPAPQPIAWDRAVLDAYAGGYRSALTRVDLRAEAGELIAQVTPLGGFPDISSPPGPPAPPVRLAQTGEDRMLVLDAPYKNNRAEIIRDAEGRVAWLRFGGRAHRREG